MKGYKSKSTEVVGKRALLAVVLACFRLLNGQRVKLKDQNLKGSAMLVRAVLKFPPALGIRYGSSI